MEKRVDCNRPHDLAFRLKERELIPRYTRPEMGHVWSDANKFAKWLEVELADEIVQVQDGPGFTRS